MTIGLAINLATKQCREIIFSVAGNGQAFGDMGIRIFYGSPATTASHLAKFTSFGIDGLVVCGFSKEQVRSFLKAIPKCLPIVLGTYGPMLKKDRELLGCGGTVTLDNEQIGSLAAEFFHGHGLRNFAFFGSNIYREFVSSEIRCSAFEKRLQAICGESISFARFMSGEVMSNDDCWDSDRDRVVEWLRKLPLPCGVFVNGEIEVFKLLRLCKMLGIDVPGQIELIGIDNAYGFCEQAEPTISSIRIDFETAAKEALRMVTSLIADPQLPQSQRDVKVGVSKMQERGSTASGRGYGLIVERAKEYIRANACSGIGIKDVARNLNVSRRLLELRIRESLGQSVLSLIQAEKLKEVCRLLTTTELSIMNVTTAAGYSTSGNLGMLFKKTFGMSMRQYRKVHRKAG